MDYLKSVSCPIPSLRLIILETSFTASWTALQAPVEWEGPEDKREGGLCARLGTGQPESPRGPGEPVSYCGGPLWPTCAVTSTFLRAVLPFTDEKTEAQEEKVPGGAPSLLVLSYTGSWCWSGSRSKPRSRDDPSVTGLVSWLTRTRMCPLLPAPHLGHLWLHVTADAHARSCSRPQMYRFHVCMLTPGRSLGIDKK